MSASQSEFIIDNLSKLGYSSKTDIIESLYLSSLKDSYERLDKTISTENQIRDRFIEDLYQNDHSSIKQWLQLKVIYLNWENWSLDIDGLKVRSDFSFKFSGMEFIIECKRLKSADKAYIDEGVERFVNLKYAEGDEYAGMIGFVISGDKNSISEGLQDKIKLLDHTLSLNKVTPIPFFNSKHQRINKTQIELYHMFFDFTLT
ncbi:hypothetical protein [uncultured Roseivirga sp.]|mgnify:CR=1 FL=1|uniref:hypothetical protein n=1 Tax=uncultured Roseivirga sp. TaxID=543088 RepID=UPI000D7A0E74|nr:hypothetical protein [uncultured Roseivirga sp.]PWL29336.1 MAG: hypothetical protein DCO95_12945 [Roseivirga sp. XM-24bin3]